MREQVVPISMKGEYDKLRIKFGAEPKSVDPFLSFSHSYREVSSAVEMSVKGESGKDESAMRRTSMQARQQSQCTEVRVPFDGMISERKVSGRYRASR